jgi:hypothetical protein
MGNVKLAVTQRRIIERGTLELRNQVLSFD